ncbi:MAG: hypothetical protein RIR70_1233 [Pseudomonadota bacterium]|jgi:hypothetical protein
MEHLSDSAPLSLQLQDLKIEHRDLDLAISRLQTEPSDDELLVRRLKKRKLFLKDRIALIERMLEPDELA